MVERQDLGEVQSAPCADNSASFASAKRQIKISGKVGENAEGSAASKADLDEGFGCFADVGWLNNPWLS